MRGLESRSGISGAGGAGGCERACGCNTVEGDLLR